MNDYTYQDMMRMQSDARRRVFEMQKRSKDAVDDFNGKQKTFEKNEKENTEDLPRIAKAISYPAELHSQSRRGSASGTASRLQLPDIRKALYSVFGNLTEDDYEKMFILSLCLLLTKEGADDSLILSLMYLLS